MSTIAVDAAQWPIVIVNFPSQISDADMLTYFHELQALRSRRTSYSLVIDVTASQPLTPKQRKLQADYIKEEAGLERLYLRGVAFVAPSSVHRGILTAIFWLQRSPVPHHACPTLAEAMAWARRSLMRGVS